MAGEKKRFLMVTDFKETIVKDFHKVKESMFGNVVQLLKEILSKEFVKVLELCLIKKDFT